jgi:hypothetical protein
LNGHSSLKTTPLQGVFHARKRAIPDKMPKYNEYKKLDLSRIGKDIKKFWEENRVFEKSLEIRHGTYPVGIL